jgi:hypothetical protein
MLWEWGTIRILSKIDSHLWSYISFLPVYLRPLQNNVTKKTTVYIESDTKYQCKSRAPVRLYETLGISSVYFGFSYRSTAQTSWPYSRPHCTFREK